MTEVRYPNTTMKIIDGTESTSITPQSIEVKDTNNVTTITISSTEIQINGLAGTNGQLLQKSVIDNSMVWGGVPFSDTANNTLDMDTYGIINVANINSVSATDLNINGQTVFNTPPHIPDPVLGNDAASKGYVDGLIGNYSGNGLTLYFNYATTQTDPIIAPSVGVLQQTLAPINSPTTNNFYTMTSIASGTNTLISTFTTDVGFPNTLTIPTGLWSMLIWGYTTAQPGQLYYHFHLNEVSSAGAFVAQIGTSGFSSDVNAINSADPDAFHCSLALVGPYTMASVNSRLQIQVYTTGTGAVPLNLFTLFGGDYYSNITSTLSGATSLLTQNNTWTGVNNFTAGFLTNGVDSAVAGTLNLGTTNSTLTTIGSITNPTAINALNFRVNINGTTGSAGQMLASTGNPIAGVSFQNVPFVPTATQALNMSTFGIVGSSMDTAGSGTLTLGGTHATTTSVGRTAVGTITNVVGEVINLTGAVKTNDIDTATAGALSIGATNTNAIQLNNKPISGLTLAANQFVTLGTVTTLPAVNQIGYNYTPGLIPNGTGYSDNTNLASGTAQEYGVVTNIPAGVYMVSAVCSMRQTQPTTIIGVVMTISGASASTGPFIDRKGIPPNGGASALVSSYSLSGVISRGSTIASISCFLNVTFANTAPTMVNDSFRFNIVRIA